MKLTSQTLRLGRFTVLLLTLVAAVTSEQELCGDNQVWNDCPSTCDPTCVDPFPKCTKDCSTNSKCECAEKYVLDIKSDCIHYDTCPPLCDAPTKEYCGSGCEPTCDKPNPICMDKCVRLCECDTNIHKELGHPTKCGMCPDDTPIFHEGKCIAKTACPCPSCPIGSAEGDKPDGEHCHSCVPCKYGGQKYEVGDTWKQQDSLKCECYETDKDKEMAVCTRVVKKPCELCGEGRDKFWVELGTKCPDCNHCDTTECPKLNCPEAQQYSVLDECCLRCRDCKLPEEILCEEIVCGKLYARRGNKAEYRCNPGYEFANAKEYNTDSCPQIAGVTDFPDDPDFPVCVKQTLNHAINRTRLKEFGSSWVQLSNVNGDFEGLVCDDGFTDGTARAICRKHGFNDGVRDTTYHKLFGDVCEDPVGMKMRWTELRCNDEACSADRLDQVPCVCDGVKRTCRSCKSIASVSCFNEKMEYGISIHGTERKRIMSRPIMSELYLKNKGRIIKELDPYFYQKRKRGKLLDLKRGYFMIKLHLVDNNGAPIRTILCTDLTGIARGNWLKLRIRTEGRRLDRLFRRNGKNSYMQILFSHEPGVPGVPWAHSASFYRNKPEDKDDDKDDDKGGEDDEDEE